MSDPGDPTTPGARAGDADRRGELIAAALAGDLSPAEAAELDRLRASDPTVDEELALLGGTADAVASLHDWHDVAPGDELRHRVEALADDPHADSPARPEARPGSAPTVAPVVPLRRRRLPTVLAAAACLVVGAGLGALATAPRDAAVEGPAGTLGAVEHIAFDGVPSGVDVDGDLVAHTWGTETVLTVDGLPVGEAFSVVVVDDAGGEHPSGTFLGSEVPVDCRLNAAVLREHVAAVEIRSADGDVAVATVPPVDA